MKLRIAAEACFEGGIEQGMPPSVFANTLKPLDALSVAHIHEVGPGLLLEEAAQPRRAETHSCGQLVQREPGAVAAKHACGTLYRRMQLVHRHARSSLETLPGLQQNVTEPGVEETVFIG